MNKNNKKYKSILINYLGLITISIFNCPYIKADEIWEPLSNIESKNITKSIKKDKSSKKSNESIIRRIKIAKNKKSSSQSKWFSIKDKERSKSKLWQIVSGHTNDDELFSSSPSKNIYDPPKNIKDANIAYSQIVPRSIDYPPLIKLSPSFPTANQLDIESAQLTIYSLSAFSGGAASGTGNQNYAGKLDYGFGRNIQLSGFYAVADDPLYSKISSHSSEKTPNYWENYGASIKFPILKLNTWKLGFHASLETWKVRSGGPNIFNNSNNIVEKTNIIGSVSFPLTKSIGKDIELSLITGASFLPKSQGKGQGGKGDFYGNNIFAGSGISWQPITKLKLLSSIIYPFGPGNNSFNDQLKYERNPILNFGVNIDLNPRIGIEAIITNGFGATPATGILTIPSENLLGYYAGIKYTPYGLDSPQSEFSERQTNLSIGGLTVNTALVPIEGSTQIWGNIDNQGNIFGYYGYSLSNIFQLDVLNVGRFRGVPSPEGERGDLVDRYTNDKGLKTRVGGKLVILSPLRNAPIWSSIRVSAGRNQDIESRQGYLFVESINTWQFKEKIALSLNPKIAWSNVSTPIAVGFSANIKLNDEFDFIPEYNLVDKTEHNNATLAIRWKAKDHLTIDLYASTAAGLQDMGQMITSKETRLGARFNLMY